MYSEVLTELGIGSSAGYFIVGMFTHAMRALSVCELA